MRDVLSYVPTRTAYAKCKSLATSPKKTMHTAYAKAVTRRIQEPTRQAEYANPTRMHTFHTFTYATFKGVPFLYKPFHLKKNAAHIMASHGLANGNHIVDRNEHKKTKNYTLNYLKIRSLLGGHLRQWTHRSESWHNPLKISRIPAHLEVACMILLRWILMASFSILCLFATRTSIFSAASSFM